jgi:hypothetical protein
MTLTKQLMRDAVILLGFFLLWKAMLVGPADPQLPALAYAGLWVGVGACFALALWLHSLLPTDKGSR